MGALGYIVGGAMQGIGAGMAQKAEMDAKERRELAMENLRQQNGIVTMREQGRINDENAAKSDARKDFYGARETQRNASVDAARDQRKFGYDVQLKQLDFANDQQMAQLDSSLSRQNDAASQNLRASIDRGEVKDVFESGDGQYWARYGDGSMKPTGVKVPEQRNSRSGGALERVRTARGVGTGVGSGATAAPAAPAKSPAPAKPASKPAAAKPAPVKPGSRGTISMAQVDEMAKEAGYTRAEALRYAENMGYKVQPATAAKPKPAPSLQKRWEMGLSGQTK